MADEFVLPDPTALANARNKLITQLPNNGLGLETLTSHLHNDIGPALSRSSTSARYYGFVTGGATPAAALADNLVTQHDQNAAVHIPADSVAVDVEDAALRMVCDLLNLDPADWPHRIFTTGATASNLLALACARESVVNAAAAAAAGKESGEVSVAEVGLTEAMRIGGLEGVQILTTQPHSSVLKSASIVGLGRACVHEVGRKDAPLRFDLDALRAALERRRWASIVVVSCAEVNTGFFATDGREMRAIRELCDRHSAWLHVDAAFGLLARALPAREEYAVLRDGVAGMELADSITGDAHKLLNVPYDSGIFLSRHLSLGTQVFQNPNAAYLSTSTVSIPSPLNLGVENSRRFRALPVYATLAAYGREWYAEMLQRQIALARAIAEWIRGCEGLVLLPEEEGEGPLGRRVYMIVLFAAREDEVNRALVERINSQRRLYVSGTSWAGRPAARFAVANWRVDVKADLQVVKDVLTEALR